MVKEEIVNEGFTQQPAGRYSDLPNFAGQPQSARDGRDDGRMIMVAKTSVAVLDRTSRFDRNQPVALLSMTELLPRMRVARRMTEA